MKQPDYKQKTLLIIGIMLIILLGGCNVFGKSWPPVPQPGTGIVIGTISSSSKSKSHFNAKDLYLAKMVSSSQANAAPIISFTPATDPSTSIQNKDGSFAFTNVQPGMYVLIIWTPMSSSVIRSGSGEIIKLNVESGKVADLGIITLP